MPLDHFVPQVHIKNFYSADLDLVRVIRKSDMKQFNARSQDICRIEDNSSNSYLRTERAVEDFLREVEPKYNASVAKLRENRLDQESIFVIAGFVAYVLTCSPAGMRLQTEPLKTAVESTALILDAQGEISASPDELGNKSLTALLEEGTVRIKIDPKYPQAMGIASTQHFVSVFGNSHWDTLVNEYEDSSFFTSDFPVAIEVIDVNLPINRIVPLAPDLVIRIVPDTRLGRSAPDFSFSNFSYTRKNLQRTEVLGVNRLIVRCAEDLVLYRDQEDWIEKFVAKNRSFRIEPISGRTPTPNGYLNFSTLRVVRHE